MPVNSTSASRRRYPTSQDAEGAHHELCTTAIVVAAIFGHPPDSAGGVAFAYRELGPPGQRARSSFFVHLAATLDNVGSAHRKGCHRGRIVTT